MFRNYIKTALRNLLRNRTSTIINITGLALGLAAFICISAYVRYERLILLASLIALPLSHEQTQSIR